MGSASAFQSFVLGAGHPTNVDRWTRSFPIPTRRTGRTLLNPHGRKAWREDGPTGGRDLWEMHGVWEWDGAKEAGVVLVESYFVKDPATGRKVRLHFSRLVVGATNGSAGRLVYRFLLPVFEAVDRSGAWRSGQRTRA
jgi:hypothetical protein